MPVFISDDWTARRNSRYIFRPRPRKVPEKCAAPPHGVPRLAAAFAKAKYPPAK
jgi:hypothetical protein